MNKKKEENQVPGPQVTDAIADEPQALAKGTTNGPVTETLKETEPVQDEPVNAPVSEFAASLQVLKDNHPDHTVKAVVEDGMVNVYVVHNSTPEEKYEATGILKMLDATETPVGVEGPHMRIVGEVDEVCGIIIGMQSK